MTRSYKATGINLKGMPMGETDRLLTVLTVEQGLVRVIVPGARKHKSRLAGRSSQFVVNELLIVKGKRLDKLVQAETVRSFPGLAADLGRLTASQYLAELVLCQALSEQPQGELFALLVAQLQRLEQAEREEILACLSHGILQLLMLAGVAPEVRQCSVSQVDIVPDVTRSDWRVGFSPVSGGLVSLAQINTPQFDSRRVRASVGRYAVNSDYRGAGLGRSLKQPKTMLLTAQEVLLLQYLCQSEVLTPQRLAELQLEPEQMGLVWQRIERLLRQYAEYHFDRPILSATLIDTCFPVAVPSE